MRKNRRAPYRRQSGLTVHTAWISSLLMLSLVAALIYVFADSRCAQLSQSIGRETRRLGRLEDERVRESARWDEMKTAGRLERALLRHGLAMDYPKACQIVRMGADGRPRPGQVAVARALQRRKAATRVASAQVRR